MAIASDSIPVYNIRPIDNMLLQLLFFFYLVAVTADKLLDLQQKQQQQRRYEDALKYSVEAGLCTERGEYENAVSFYRASVRLVPDSFDFQFSLGVAETHVKLWSKASARFDKALALNATMTEDRPYRALIAAAMPAAKTRDGLPEDPRLRDLENLSVNCVFSSTPSEAPNCPVNALSRPFTIRHTIDDSSLESTLGKISTLALRMAYPDDPVDFYPQNIIEKPQRTYKVSLEDAIRYLEYPEGAYLSVDASMPGTYIQMNANESTFSAILQLGNISLDSLLSGFIYSNASRFVTSLPAALRADFLHRARWHMILIGEEGAGMFGHEDIMPVGSWQLQVTGRKRWRICESGSSSSSSNSTRLSRIESASQPSVATRACPDRGDEGCPSPSTRAIEREGEEVLDRHTSVDQGDGGDCWETVLHPGDVIYYPPNYWHETRCLDSPTISVSTSVEVGPSLLYWLRSQCDLLAKSKFSSPPELCMHVYGDEL